LFDLGKTRRDLCRVELRESDELEYFFYYGPRPMGILEEHMRVRGPAGDITTEDVVNVDAARSRRDATTLPAPASRGWSALGDVIRSAGHAGLSGILFPALNLGFFAAETDAIHRRAAQLAALMPIVYRTGPERQGAETARVHREMAEKRRRWAPYLVTYVEEAYLRGSPVVRPLPAHFPDDASAAGFADQFMVGDEVLAAPVFDDNPVRRVYLPMGVWTELHNNAAHQGRRVVEVEAPPDAAPLLAKNGSIVPLARDGSTAPMELHYFPKLAAEFFLIEPDSGDYSQFHAAPAGEYFRLEIESLADRDYEWVVHHVEPVREVRRGSAVFSEVGKASLLRPGSWFYDGASRNLHVQVHAPAGDDVVVKIAFR
jgi:alpha-glucosidase (family GH31 glycosyl hydrolase)